MRNVMSALAVVVALACAAPALADTAVTLRAHVEAHGPAVTLSDIFDGAGDVGGRAVAPAPAPGQASVLGAPFLAAAAQSAGLSWSPPEGVTQVRVVRPGGARALIAPQSNADPASQSSNDFAVHRGETVQLIYVAPGLQLTTRARALGNASVGDSVRLINLQSNRTVDAVVTGPGAAAASAP